MSNINDLIKRVDKQKFVLSKFLDQTESSELRKIKSRDFRSFFSGGYIDAERTRCILISYDQDEPLEEEFSIKVLELTLTSNIRPVTHRHVLGTLMGLGIKRETVGDILVEDNKIIIFVIDEMVNFIKNNLFEINQISVNIKEVEINDIVFTDKSEERLINVASMRLDAIVSRCQNVSRNSSVELIEKGLVQINHIECLNPSYTVKVNDLISIRHFGRVQVLEIVNTTKKDRLVVKVNIKH